MENMSIFQLQLYMLIGFFALGGIAFLLGLAILVINAWGRDLRALTNQTTRLAQKGLAEEISGLVGNASTLLATINEVMRTATGIGIFLCVSGALLMGVATFLILQQP